MLGSSGGDRDLGRQILILSTVKKSSHRCGRFPLQGDEFLVFRGVQAKPERPLGGDVVEEIKMPDSGKRKP